MMPGFHCSLGVCVQCSNEGNRDTVGMSFYRFAEATKSRTRTGHPVDAITLPFSGHVAPPHGTMEYFTYEAIPNLLGWTYATIPVAHVDPKLDRKFDGVFEAISDFDQRNRDKCIFSRECGHFLRIDGISLDKPNCCAQ